MISQSVAQISNAMGSINASVDNHDAKVVTSRQPASGYLTLNSRDRYINASPNQQAPALQPWNNFILQRAQSIIPTYARRLAITEVRFPWYIPNIIVDVNNTLSLALDISGGPIEYITVMLDQGFYTPTLLATQINDLIAGEVASIGDAPSLTWSPFEGRFTLNRGTNDTPVAILAPPGTTYNSNPDPLTPAVPAVSSQYYNSPSLALLIGVPSILVSADPADPEFVAAADEQLAPTTCLYTDYVDIVSDKLMRFTDARDGGSAEKTKTSLVMRLYLADESSLQNVDDSGNPIVVGTSPFLIHRQFSTPKQVQWDPKSFVADLDLQIFDMFGNPIYTPEYGYPDYQITMLASEN